MGRDGDDNLLQTLVSLEEQGWQALSQGTGAGFYAEHLARDAAMVFPIGVMDRQQSIDSIGTAPPWATYRIEDPRVLPLTDDSVVLIYRCSAQRTGQDPYSAFMTTTYVRRDGTWKTAVHQHTPVTG